MTDINDLPVEVLGYIFNLAAEDERSTPSTLRLGRYLRFWGGKFHSACAPFVFLSVCGHWRAVAEATPLLWTPLDATMRTACRGALMPIEALEHWLSLSKSAPLEFFLQGSNREDDSSKEEVAAHTEAMLDVLANQAHRWRSAAFEVDFHLAGVLVDMLLNQFNPVSLPNLKKLEVVAFYDKRGPLPVEDLARAIGGIQSLKELYLYMHHDECVPSLLRDIPWGQLTTVYLGMDLSVHQVATILALSSSAVTATFDGVYGAPVSDSNEQRSTLVRLKTLTMNGREGIFSLLDRFNFPGLEQLNIISSSYSNDEPLKRLVERSPSRIRQIGLHVKGRLSGSDLAKYLRMLRQVSHVEFNATGVREIAPSAVDQLKDDIPVLWFWRPFLGLECIGWKTQFDRTDGQVIRITPATKIVT